MNARLPVDRHLEHASEQGSLRTIQATYCLSLLTQLSPQTGAETLLINTLTDVTLLYSWCSEWVLRKQNNTKNLSFKFRRKKLYTH